MCASIHKTMHTHTHASGHSTTELLGDCGHHDDPCLEGPGKWPEMALSEGQRERERGRQRGREKQRERIFLTTIKTSKQ